MREKIKKIFITFLFCFILLIMLWTLDAVFERKYSRQKYEDFYIEKEDFDVLFLGTSHVINAIYPMELWERYGITSYNMANHSENICVNYWQLVNALRYTKPKVVVVDLYAIDADAKVNLKYLHNFTDTIPAFDTKMRMVMDLLPKEEWPEYLFEFSLYHTRWDEDLSYSDLKPEKRYEKGAEFRAEVIPNEIPVLISKEEFDSTPRVNKEYLKKIIELCKKEDIEIVLTYLPYSAPISHQKPANWGYFVSQQYNVPYINMLYENVIDYKTDCADEGSHLNVCGAINVTTYLGEYLVESYHLQNHKSDDKYEHWDEDYEEYWAFVLGELDKEQNFYSYLAILYELSPKCDILIRADSEIETDDLYCELINNIEKTGNVQIDRTSEIENGMIHIKVVQIDTGECLNDCIFKRISETEYEMQ